MNIVAILIASLIVVATSVTTDRPESKMYVATKAFLAALRPDQAAKASLPFNSEERFNWYYVPRDRKGIPCKVREGPMKGTRVLAAEEDLGRSLLKSLTAEQRKEALVSDKAPGDILTNNQRTAAIQEDTGLAYSKMNKTQQGLLLQLINEYAGA